MTHREAAIDALWSPGAPIKSVELDDLIESKARALIRQGIAQEWGKLKPMDAIHLATAQQMAVVDFHTHRKKLHKWDGAIGFSVSDPQTAQGVLGVEPANS